MRLVLWLRLVGEFSSRSAEKSSPKPIFVRLPMVPQLLDGREWIVNL